MSQCVSSWISSTGCIMNRWGGQAGQSIVEFIIIIPMFFMLLFGIFEFTFIYKAKATLNTATFEAARAGSLNHGKTTMMVDTLAKGMTPLYMKGSGTASTVGMSTAYAQSRQVALALELLPTVNPVEIISPSPEVVEAFSVQRAIQLDGDTHYKLETFIPSDNLYFRSSEDVAVEQAGETHMMNVQDANILKIRTFWCYRMKTPVVSKLIKTVLTNPLLSATAQEQALCNAGSLASGGNYLVLRSHAVIRMQTHFLKEES